MHVVVVGAGLAGCYVANTLQVDNKITVLEKKSRVGGRIKTIYNEKLKNCPESVKYESGAWRIPDTHNRVLHLAKKLGLTLRKVPVQASLPCHNVPVPNQSVKGSNLLSTQSVSTANNCESGTGFDGIHSKMHTRGKLDLNCFYVIEEGMQKLCTRLYSKIKKNAHVLDVTFKSDTFHVTYEHNGRQKFIHCDAVFVCVPLEATRSWGIYPSLQNLDSSVGALALQHVYANIEQGWQWPHPSVFTDLPIQQLHHSNYKGPHQIAYSGGEVAKMWQNLALTDKKAFIAELENQLSQQAGQIITISDVQQHHWNEAIHYWRPTLCDVDALARRAVRPDVTLPQLYVAGEAISTYQGWMEGALETAERAVFHFGTLAKQTKPQKYVMYRGNIVNIEDWIDRHPGGRDIIEKHMGRDITEIWDRIHPNSARHLLYSLQCC